MLIQKKWKTLRDGYTRYAKKIKPKSGSAARNIRPYAYYQQMSFLKAIIEDRPDKSNSLQESEHVEIKIEEIEHSLNEINKGGNKRKLTTTITDENVPIEKSPKRFDGGLQNSRSANEDEDKLFLLSLVGEFKKIEEEYKLDAKAEILHLIKRFKGIKNHTYPSSYDDRGYSSHYLSVNGPSTSTSGTGPPRSAPGFSTSMADDQNSEFEDHPSPSVTSDD